MTSEEARKLMPNFCAIGWDKELNEDNVLFYHISGRGKGEPSYSVPLSEILDMVHYLETYYPNMMERARNNRKVKI